MKTTDANQSLFYITQERVALEAIMEELSGELTPELEEALKLNRDQLAAKGESYVYILEQLHAYQELNRRYLEQAKRNIDRAEKSMERLKGTLLEAAKVFGEFQAGIHSIGTRKSTSVTIENQEEITDEFLVKKLSVTPDKKAIGEALKDGKAVPGASLSHNLNLKIS